MQDLDVKIHRAGEPRHVIRIRGDDVVTVGGQEHDRGVDDVRRTRDAEQSPCGSPQAIIDRSDIDALESSRQLCLAGAASPHLSDHASVRDRYIADGVRCLQADPHRSLAPIEGDERPAVEHHRHADSAFGMRRERPLSSGGRPRTITAPARSVRPWAAISSGVIVPNSASYASTAF